MENGKLVEKQDLVPELKRRIALSQQPVVILTVDAGDIDRLVPEITKSLNTEY